VFRAPDSQNYSVNARCLDDYDPVEMRPRRFFDGRNWEAAFAKGEAERAENPRRERPETPLFVEGRRS
jgi:hypothetical protein